MKTLSGFYPCPIWCKYRYKYLQHYTFTDTARGIVLHQTYTSIIPHTLTQTRLYMVRLAVAYTHTHGLALLNTFLEGNDSNKKQSAVPKTSF